MRAPFLCSQGVQNGGVTVYDCVVHKTWEQSQFTADRYPFMKAKVKSYNTLPLHYTLAGCLQLVVSGWLSPSGCLRLVVSNWLSPAGCLRLVVSGCTHMIPVQWVTFYMCHKSIRMAVATVAMATLLLCTKNLRVPQGLMLSLMEGWHCDLFQLTLATLCLFNRCSHVHNYRSLVAL